MRLIETQLAGVFEIAAEPIRDERGFFARLYCPEAFAKDGIEFTSTQINLSRNDSLGTLRGLHYQDPPNAEAKIVRIVRGAVFEAVVDLRPTSPTYRRHLTWRLDAETGLALLVPEGCAHGFLTLESDTDVLYQMGRPFVPGHARGVRFDDPAFGIDWPAGPSVIAPQDRAWPPFSPSNPEGGGRGTGEGAGR